MRNIKLYEKKKGKFAKVKQFFKKIKIIMNQLFIIILNRIYAFVLPLKENRVLFLSDSRKKLGGNLKCMYDYLPSEQYEKIVILKSDRRKKRTLKEKITLIKCLSTSKYILLEDLVQATSHIKIRKEQELVQLWHGPGAFKKFGHSREGTDLKHIHKGYKKYTKAIVSSEAIRPCYAEAFSISEDKVQATGFPRTDIFFDENYKEAKKKELYEQYPFLKGKKVILFAPTYRGTQFDDAHYDIQKLNLQKIYENLSKENYIFIFKWHPFLYNNIQLKRLKKYEEYQKYPDFYYDLSRERDINDLLLVTDILITDYSSVIFDYYFTNKPIIYFTYDLKKYEGGRGLYFPFEEYIYGAVAQTDEELLDAIQEENMEPEKREKFYKKFISSCDGNSTYKTYKWIFENKLER